MLKDGPIWALGAMSGTSLDGIDGAMVLTDGETITEFGETGYRAYTPDEQASLRAALGQWQAPPGLAEMLETAHAKLLSGFEGAQIAGFHGQTLTHDPGGRGTFQLGSGEILAQVLGLPVVWDFRSMDVQMGGQGAPLAPFFHFACTKFIGASKPVVFLNLGGVGNVTWVDPTKGQPTDTGALLAFDTGPANAPINDLMQERCGQAFDRDGALAASGIVAGAVLDDFLADAYFHRIPPKSLDRGSFSMLKNAVAELSDADAAATLTAIAAASVVKAFEHFPAPVSQVLVSGGGRNNPVMMQMLRAGLDCAVDPVEKVGLNGDMLEAQAFAYLAVRVARGLPTSCSTTTGVAAAVGGGQISQPSA